MDPAPPRKPSRNWCASRRSISKLSTRFTKSKALSRRGEQPGRLPRTLCNASSEKLWANAIRHPFVGRSVDRIVPMLSLESREAWGLMSFHAEKEGLERFVYPTKNVLQDLRMDARYIGSDCFDFAELIGLGIVIEFCSLCLVSVPPLL